jgi:hypothetical protein
MANEWKKRGDTYTKRVSGLTLLIDPISVHWWSVELDGGHELVSGFEETLPAAQRAAERFVERLRKAVKP